ncbi:MAG TPA: hypothetical protein VJT73_06830 [Polyangiaceae bacterium]|nr:hypothetical protein [Polyangiaceae bacterium]
MTSSRRAGVGTSVAASLLMLATTACRLASPRFESLDPQQMPEDLRHDYALFAQRCSKCHSLSRPLQSGITDDLYWTYYVERMRRQQGSGISPEDQRHILRFLHYFSTGKVRPEQAPETTTEPADSGDPDGGEPR